MEPVPLSSFEKMVSTLLGLGLIKSFSLSSIIHMEANLFVLAVLHFMPT